MHKGFLRTSFILLSLAVGLGAFGSHGLKPNISAGAFDIYQTMVNYLFYHAFPLAITGIVYHSFHNRWIIWAGRLFTIGIILFCGSLFLLTIVKALVLPGWGWIGPVTPIGGVAFIAGWLFLAIGLSKSAAA